MRRIENTVLMKRRLSSAGRPTLPGPPERCGAMVSQARLEMSWRRCAGVVVVVISTIPLRAVLRIAPFYHPNPNLTTGTSGWVAGGGMASGGRVQVRWCGGTMVKFVRSALPAAVGSVGGSRWDGVSSYGRRGYAGVLRR